MRVGDDDVDGENKGETSLREGRVVYIAATLRLTVVLSSCVLSVFES